MKSKITENFMYLCDCKLYFCILAKYNSYMKFKMYKLLYIRIYGGFYCISPKIPSNDL